MARRAAVLALCLMLLPILAFAAGSEAKEEEAPAEAAPAEAAPEEGGGETAAGIRAALQGYITAFQSKDIDGVMAAFADAPNTVMMGTGPDEVWLGKDDIRMAHEAFFSDFKKESSERTLVSVGANGDVAWLSGYIEVTREDEDDPDKFQINLSLVLERLEGVWYITAMHFSNLTGPE